MSRPPPSWIVVIAASAGGVEALIELLSALPQGSKAPLLIVQHTRTDTTSLASTLARQSGRNVRLAAGGETPREGEVYLAPHGQHLILAADGRLALTGEAPDHHVRPSADRLFSSAAAAQGKHLVGVVLSGTGSDGAAGVIAVKQQGGIVIVQDEPSALFSAMPRAAAQTGCADYVLPIASIGPALVRVTKEPPVSTEISADEFENLLGYLSQTRGFDVSAYKRATLMRRIKKRMNEVGAETIADYEDRLQVHPDEFAHLFNTILINVTTFFRDPEQWQHLENEVIPLIAGGGDDSRSIRIWSAGCATGQEAYSAAILFAERLGTAEFRKRVKIYATDVDDDALAKARSASYTADEVENVPEQLRVKYFDSSGTRFSFRQDLRRSLIFGRHDLVQDAPISKADLLLCRNTLMYFTSEIQSRILARLHYALKDDGYLMLGKAEMLLTHGNLFRPVDMKQRIFTKIPGDGLRDRFGVLRAMEPEAVATGPSSRELLELAGDVAPYAQLIVDGDARLVAANANARLWFGIGENETGRLLQDLEVSYRPVELRSLISRAHAELQTVNVQNVERPQPNGETLYLDVAVTPLRDGEKAAGVSIVFNDVTRFHELRGELDRSRHDLETAYEELQSTNEELETTNEELQSTIEELETTNEELQSSNEELETMNEELESTNAELQAMNEEMRRRTEEIDQVNSFMNSVMGSLELGVIVVDRRLHVQMWNSRSEELWGVRSVEAVGEVLTNLDIGLPIAETLAIVKNTLAGDGTTSEVTLEAVNRRGRQIRCRVVSTSLTLDGGQQGVVLLVEQVAE